MASNNPNFISGALRAQLDSPLERAAFDVAQIGVRRQGHRIESIASSPGDEIEARMKDFNDALPIGLPGTKVAWLLGVTGAIIDRRADESDRELAARELARVSHGGSE